MKNFQRVYHKISDNRFFQSQFNRGSVGRTEKRTNKYFCPLNFIRKIKYWIIVLNFIFFLLIYPSIYRISFGQKTIDPSHFIPSDKNLSTKWKSELWQKERKIYKGEELTTIGMPCGGIAAGQLYVRGDGTLANWWIANNAYNTGYGIDSLLNFMTPFGPWKVCYQTFEPFSYIDQGFSVTIRQTKETIIRKLNKTDFDDITFIGEYPIARISYASLTNPIPLQIEAEVFSPFIPLNAKESATPGTIIKYHIKNLSSKPMTVTLTGWLQNLVCLEIKNEIIANSRNRIVRNEGLTSVVMDIVKGAEQPAKDKQIIELFDDFETGIYSKWEITGTAFGSNPVDSNLTIQQMVSGYEGRFYVNSFHGGDNSTGKMISIPFSIKHDYIQFLIGGGAQKGRTCINLIVNEKIVRTETGHNSERLELKSWDVREFRNQQAHFEIIDDAVRGWGHINVDHLAFSNLPAVKEKYFPELHPYFGNVALSILSDNVIANADYNGVPSQTPLLSTEKKIGEKLVGALSTAIDLKPGESTEVSYLITWYFPNRPMNYGGGSWNKPLNTEGAVIGNMYANWFDSSLDVALWLNKNLVRLSEETHKFHDCYYNNTTLPYWLIQRIMMPVSTLATETCQWWATDKFWAWEGVGSCEGTCTHVWNYEHAMARLFPELERNVREKTDFTTSFDKDGGIHARNGGGAILIDGQAGAILKAYREHLLSKDKIFLSRNWDKIKKAMQFLIKEDENSDGLIEKKQGNTYDIAFYGANTYVGGLYLAALKASMQMASIMNDTSFVKRCSLIYTSGLQLTMEKLWNGEYFIQDVNLVKYPKYQYATGCLSDQLLGQTWAHLNNLGYIYPEKNVRITLESIWKYNWTPDVGIQNRAHPPERVYANPGEPGLLVCTWPKSVHPGEDGVRYRDEVWTGIEYQVATNMIYEGMIEEALSLVKGIHERYSPEKHNPWNEVECGDHYARAMASWGVLIALEDYFFNGPEKILRFVPKVQQDNFKGFFTAAEGWGNIEQTRIPTRQINTVLASYGRVQLKTLEVELQKKPEKVQVFLGSNEIPCTYLMNNNLLTVKFQELTVNYHQPLKLVVEFSINNNINDY